jgi:transcriptional regulator with XRE-family HTH domain
MITKEQCRAARSFLGIKQAELANDCGLSKTAITHFESGLFTPRADNMTAIQSSLESRGIEFIGKTGVQKRETTVRLIEGESMFQELWSDVFDTLKHSGGEVCIAYVDERKPMETAGEAEALKDHLERLDKHNITERLIVCEGDSYFVQPQECYRWMPYNVFKSGNLFFVYGDTVATHYWEGHAMTIVKNKIIAKEEKKRFEYLWEMSRLPEVFS